MELKTKFLLNQFFNEYELVSISFLNDGLINQTLLIEISREGKNEKYILQKINPSVFHFPSFITENMEIIANHLKQNRYPHSILEVVKSKDGNALVFDQQQNPWRLTKYFENTKCYTKVESVSQAYESSRMFSIFYKYLIDFDTKNLKTPIEGFTNFENRMNAFEGAVRDASEELKILAKAELDYLLENKYLPEKFIEYQKENRFPTRVIHGDPKISNVLFDENSNHAKCIIDFDTLMPSTILYDYGDMVRSYTNNREEDDPTSENVFNHENYKAITEGFLSSIKEFLLPVELDNLVYSAKVIVYIQAVRFFTDYLNGNKYYNVKYPLQNLYRTRNQINLLKEIFKLS